VDEAGKMTEGEMWPILSYYYGLKKAMLLVIGDQNQLKPTILSTLLENCFVSQQTMTSLARNIMNGFPYVMFNEQHRLHPDICKLVSRLFYGDLLVTSKRQLGANGVPMAKALREFNQPHFGIDTSLLFIDVKHGKAETTAPAQDLFNAQNAAYVMNFVGAAVDCFLRDS
jgi:superfamily I DNA and/or RNA helicase